MRVGILFCPRDKGATCDIPNRSWDHSSNALVPTLALSLWIPLFLSNRQSERERLVTLYSNRRRRARYLLRLPRHKIPSLMSALFLRIVS